VGLGVVGGGEKGGGEYTWYGGSEVRGEEGKGEGEGEGEGGWETSSWKSLHSLH
jgi:hypothetical protein